MLAGMRSLCRSSVVALALSVSLACGKPDLGRVEGARLTPRADGGAELVVEGWPQIWLSQEEVAGRATIELSYVRGADAVAFRTVDGKWANIVWLGAATRRGPVTDAPRDFPTVMGALVATEKDSAAVLGLVRASKGKTGVANVLVKAAAVEGKTWEARLASLSDDEKAELTKGLEGAIMDGSGSPEVVSRAVAVVDVASLPVEKLMARVEPVVTAKEPEGSLGASVLLRVLAHKKSPGAGKLACQGLAGAAHAWKLDEPQPTRHLLLDAMLMAIANEGVDCPAVDALVLEEPCASTLRCGANGPVLPNETSDQREPLCSAEALKKAVEAELARGAKDTVADGHPGRTSAWAFAAHKLGKRPPLAEVEAHHARRLYAVAQAKTPDCDTLSEVGKVCRASEPVLRDQACRNAGATVSVGTLKFRVSDEKKTISDVETAPPP